MATTKSSTLLDSGRMILDQLFASLVIGDFGVKYVGKDNADHLIKVLE